MPFTAKDLYFSNSEVWLKKKKKSINDRYWIVNRQAYQVTNDLRIEQSNAQRQGSFTPIYLHIHAMNFEVVRARNSYTQFKVMCDGKWRNLNYAWWHEAVPSLYQY